MKWLMITAAPALAVPAYAVSSVFGRAQPTFPRQTSNLSTRACRASGV